MKFAIVSSLVSLILSCDHVLGQASLLQKRFAIEGPLHSYEDLTFTMEYEISDFIDDSMIGYTLYDGHKCKDGDGFGGDNDITLNAGYILHKIRTDNAPPGDGSGTRSVKLSSKVIVPDISYTPLYRTDSEGNGVVKYCVRMGVFNTDRNEPMSMEINFLETLVTLSINMSGDIVIEAELSNAEPLLEMNAQGVAVDAYICDYDDNTVPIMPTRQGQTVRVCVTPVPEVLAAGGLMRQIEKFDFFRQIPTVTSQSAILPGTDGVAADLLTVVQCRPGTMVCAFETLLGAKFFQGEGIINGQGLAYLQIGGGDMSTERRMEESIPDLLSPNDVLRRKPTVISINIRLLKLENFGPLLLTSGAPATATAAFMTTALLGASLTLLFTIGLLH